jgi:hypothetical protein
MIAYGLILSVTADGGTKVKPHTILLILALSIPALSSAAPVVVIQDEAEGFYNHELGTVLDGTDPAFPASESDDYFYTYPAAPDLSAADAILGNWLTDPANLNSNWTYGTIPTEWVVDTEVGVIYTVNASGSDNYVLNVGVDNGVFVWLDGAYQFGARDAGGPFDDDYTINLGQLSQGIHYLQLLYEDHGGSTGSIISLTADAASSDIPEPATLLLACLGMLGWASCRCRGG